MAKNLRPNIKHYLIDMDATLGSGSVRPHTPKSGNEYFVDFRYIVPSVLGLGLYRKAWEDAKPIHFPSIGYTEAETRYFYQFLSRDGKAQSAMRQLDTSGHIPISRDLPDGQYYGIEIRTVRSGWADKYVRIYFFVWNVGLYQIVRVDRQE